MTAPVVSALAGAESIPMTAPVISGDNRFSFVLPASYTMETAPIPIDRHVELVPVPARTVAAVRFRGRATPHSVRHRIEALLEGLRGAGIRTVGSPFLMRYNPPYTPGFLRRNEIGVEVAG